MERKLLQKVSGCKIVQFLVLGLVLTCCLKAGKNNNLNNNGSNIILNEDKSIHKSNVNQKQYENKVACWIKQELNNKCREAYDILVNTNWHYGHPEIPIDSVELINRILVYWIFEERGNEIENSKIDLNEMLSEVKFLTYFWKDIDIKKIANNKKNLIIDKRRELWWLLVEIKGLPRSMISIEKKEDENWKVFGWGGITDDFIDFEKKIIGNQEISMPRLVISCDWENHQLRYFSATDKQENNKKYYKNDFSKGKTGIETQPLSEEDIVKECYNRIKE